MFFFRSDQLSFIQRGIPAVFFTTGDHEDYHQQSDRPERIDTDKLARVARLAFHLAYEIAWTPPRRSGRRRAGARCSRGFTPRARRRRAGQPTS
jgi:hypothetical protein